jgi:hypothetical protein
VRVNRLLLDRLFRYGKLGRWEQEIFQSGQREQPKEHYLRDEQSYHDHDASSHISDHSCRMVATWSRSPCRRMGYAAHRRGAGLGRLGDGLSYGCATGQQRRPWQGRAGLGGQPLA